MAERYNIVMAVLPSAARTATGQSAALDIGNFLQCYLTVNVSAASGTTPTLDIKVQLSEDGTNWYDEGTAFTQITAAATPPIKRLLEFGRFVRVNYTIAGTTPSFTFAVNAVLKG